MAKKRSSAPKPRVGRKVRVTLVGGPFGGSHIYLGGDKSYHSTLVFTSNERTGRYVGSYGTARWEEVEATL